MVAEIFGGISAFKAMLDISKSMKDMNDAAARERVAIELREKVLSAQEAQFALVEQVSGLKAELVKFETWEAEKQKYELKSLGWNSFAYMLKPDARGSAPPHWICTNCYTDRRISIIQHTSERAEGSLYVCPKCHVSLRMSEKAFETGTGACKWLD